MFCLLQPQVTAEIWWFSQAIGCQIYMLETIHSNGYWILSWLRSPLQIHLKGSQRNLLIKTTTSDFNLLIPVSSCVEGSARVVLARVIAIISTKIRWIFRGSSENTNLITVLTRVVDRTLTHFDSVCQIRHVISRVHCSYNLRDRHSVSIRGCLFTAFYEGEWVSNWVLILTWTIRGRFRAECRTQDAAVSIILKTSPST